MRARGWAWFALLLMSSGAPAVHGAGRVEEVRYQHGCGTGASRGGETAADDLHWQALARRWDCALLGPSYHQEGYRAADAELTRRHRHFTGPEMGHLATSGMWPSPSWRPTATPRSRCGRRCVACGRSNKACSSGRTLRSSNTGRTAIRKPR
jgi:hypothetical protein